MGLLSFIRVWGSKNDRFQQLQQQQQQLQQQQQTRQVRMLQSENFLEQIKSHPSDTFFYFLNHETLTLIKSVKNSFSVKSGGLKNYKLLIRKSLLTCSFSQETCLKGETPHFDPPDGSQETPPNVYASQETPAIDDIVGPNIISILVEKPCPTVMPVRKLLY